MLASEVIQQLQIRLPQETSSFTDDIPVLTITRDDTIMTVTCSESHNLSAGDAVGITGAINPISIDNVTSSGTVATVVTSMNHDLTTPVTPTITISSNSEDVFNDTFTTINVENRRTVTFTVADGGVVSGTGGVLEDADSILNSYNSTVVVSSIPDKNSFTFIHSNTALASPIGDSIIARTNPRIGAAINLNRAQEIYTEQNIDDLCIFVVLDPVDGLKNRNIRTEAVDNLNSSNNYRQQITQAFSLYLFVPSSSELSGANARDTAEELFSPIVKSLLLHKFDSQLFVGEQGAVNFVDHDNALEEYNTAYYIHRYSFVQTVDLLFEDTVGPSPDVAFRDISFTIFPKVTIDAPATVSGSLGGDVNLDDVPL